MEIKISNKNILRISICLISVISISILFSYLMKYLRNENLKHREYDLYGLSNLRYIDTDLAFKPVYNFLERNDYFIESNNEMESNAVLEVRKKFPYLKQYIKNKKFYNLYSLTGYLLSKGQYKYEKEIFRYLLKDYKDFTFKYDYQNLLHYLNRFYMEPAKELIENKEFYRAKWLITEAISRLNLIDTKPLDQTPLPFIDYQNKLFLLRILLDNPEENIRDLKSSTQIYSALNSYYAPINYKVLHSINISKNSEFFPVFLYLKGVMELSENKNIKQAFNIFKSVNNLNDSNDFLRQLNFHLLARCTFWNCDINTYKNKEKSIDQLMEIKRSLESPNLKSDIDYYINYLNNPSMGKTKRFNQDENFILNLSL